MENLQGGTNIDPQNVHLSLTYVNISGSNNEPLIFTYRKLYRVQRFPLG